MKYFVQPPETNNNLDKGIIRISAVFEEVPECVYHALTDPAEFEIWWGSEDTYHMIHWLQDLRTGGSYTVDVLNKNGIVAPASGHFLEINAPKKFVYTRRYDWDFPGLGRRETIISYFIDKVHSGTQVQIIHEGFGEQREAASVHSAGWIRVLTWFGEYLETNNQNNFPKRTYQ